MHGLQTQGLIHPDKGASQSNSLYSAIFASIAAVNSGGYAVVRRILRSACAPNASNVDANFWVVSFIMK